MAGQSCWESHYVVRSAGAGSLVRQLRGGILLFEGLLGSRAAVPAAPLARAVLVVAFLLEAGALVNINLANTHLDPRVAGYVATPSDQLLVFLVFLLRCHQRSSHVLLRMALCLGWHQPCFLFWWRAHCLPLHTRVHLVLELWGGGGADLADLLEHSWGHQQRGFRIRRRWCWGVAHDFLIVRKHTVIPEPWKSSNMTALPVKPSPLHIMTHQENKNRSKLLHFLLIQQVFTVTATKAETGWRITPYITTVTSFLLAEQMCTKTPQTL